MLAFEVQNLDAMPVDEVRAHAELFEKLASYSRHKACAMTCRLAGSIAQALRHESRCDAIYSTLPEACLW